MGKIILLGAALVALAMAAVFGKIGIDGRRDAARFAGLERLGAHAFADGTRLGATGYVEGSIAADQPILKKGLVLYLRSRLSGFRKPSGSRSKEPTWKTLDRRLPPLRVEAGDGAERDPLVAVDVFGDYRLIFRGSDPIRLSTEDLRVGITERFEGLEPGQLVVVVGTIARRPEGGGVGLEAELVSSGSHADLLSGERTGSTFGLIAGAALTVAAIVLVLVAIRAG